MEIGALLLCPDVDRLFQLLQNSFRLGKGFRAMTDAIFFRVTQFCQCLSELGDKEDRIVPKSRRSDSLLGDQTIQHTFHGLDLIDRWVSQWQQPSQSAHPALAMERLEVRGVIFSNYPHRSRSVPHIERHRRLDARLMR